MSHIKLGEWMEAQSLQEEALKYTESTHGTQRSTTSAIRNNFAFRHIKQGGWKEAEELTMRDIETSKRVLSQEHPDTLYDIAILPTTYWNQGDCRRLRSWR
jgi:hypothetical protein